MRVSIVIPAYNEARTIGQLLTEIEHVEWSRLGLASQIIVVDDGSTDQTAAVVTAHRAVHLIRHVTTRGKGAAIRSALPHVTGDIILLQDADLEYPPSNYPALLRPMVRGEALVVYGSRFLARSVPVGMRLPNYLANRFGTWLANRLYGTSLSDEATGHKVFHRDVLRRLRLESTGFEICPELTAKVSRLGVPIVEIPIPYAARSFAQGKKFTWRHGLQVLVGLLRYRRPHPTAPS